jgi:hypothetical protein
MPTFWNTLFVPSSSAYEEGTECSETSAYKIQTPENCSEESIQHSEHGESLKSRILLSIVALLQNVEYDVWILGPRQAFVALIV